MPFARVLARKEMQKASSIIWNRITDSIFHYLNRYAKHIIINVLVYVWNKWLSILVRRHSSIIGV